MKRRTVVILIALALLVTMAWQRIKGGSGVGVDSVSWLPPEARNISYIEQFMGCRIAEFDIPREPFEAWCHRIGKPLRELAGESKTVFRCLPWLGNRGVLLAQSEPNDTERPQREANRIYAFFYTGDLFYEEHWSNGGGYTLGYDVEKQRAYYFYSHH